MPPPRTIFEISRSGAPASLVIQGLLQRIYERTCDAYDRELENENYTLVPQLAEEMARAYSDIQKLK